MDDIKAVVERLLGEGCPLKTLSDLLLGTDVSAENISELENIVNLLEMHEEEIRRLRQSISLRARQYILASYSEKIRNRSGKPE
jgi:hypothetical protein